MKRWTKPHAQLRTPSGEAVIWPADTTTTSAASAVDEAARGIAEIITSSAFTHGITALTIDNPKYASAVRQKSADMTDVYQSAWLQRATYSSQVTAYGTTK